MSDDDQTADSAGNPPGESALRAVGQLLEHGRYRLVQQLGEGSLGAVWLAEDTQVNRALAVRRIRPGICSNPTVMEDLRFGVARSRRLTHPNVARIFDLHEVDRDEVFITMEYVKGTSLEQLRQQQADGVLQWEVFRPLAVQLCAALDYAHGAGFVQGEFGPADFLIDDKGRLKLCDLGILAAVKQESRFQSGSPTAGERMACLSPQRLAGAAPCPGDDIYSLGAILYELLTGTPPFFGDDLAEAIRTQAPVPLEQRLEELGISNAIPAAVANAVLACLEKNPASRPASVRAVAAALGLEGASSNPSLLVAQQQAATIEVTRQPMWSGKRLAGAALVTVLFSILGMLLYVLLRGNHVPPDPGKLVKPPGSSSNQPPIKVLPPPTLPPPTNMVVSARGGQSQKAGSPITPSGPYQIAATFAAGKPAVERVCFSADGRVLAVLQADRRVHFWEVASFTDQAAPLAQKAGVFAFGFSNDGDEIAVWNFDETVVLGNVQKGTVRPPRSTQQPVRHLYPSIQSVGFSPDVSLLGGGTMSGRVNIWQANTGRRLHTLQGSSNEVFAIAFSPDASLLAEGGRDARVRVWEVRSGNLKSVLSNHTSTISAVAFSADGKTLASGGHDRSARLWDAQGWVQRHVFSSAREITSLALSRDGKLLATGNSDGATAIFSTETGDLVQTLQVARGIVNTLAFSPTGTLAGGSGDGTVSLWRMPPQGGVREREKLDERAKRFLLSAIAGIVSASTPNLSQGDSTTEWLEHAEYHDFFDRLGTNGIPVRVEGHAGIVEPYESRYRGWFRPWPPDVMGWAMMHGTSEKGLARGDYQYGTNGLRRVWTQQFTNSSGGRQFQAIWLRKRR